MKKMKKTIILIAVFLVSFMAQATGSQKKLTKVTGMLPKESYGTIGADEWLAAMNGTDLSGPYLSGKEYHDFFGVITSQRDGVSPEEEIKHLIIVPMTPAMVAGSKISVLDHYDDGSIEAAFQNGRPSNGNQPYSGEMAFVYDNADYQEVRASTACGNIFYGYRIPKQKKDTGFIPAGSGTQMFTVPNGGGTTLVIINNNNNNNNNNPLNLPAIAQTAAGNPVTYVQPQLQPQVAYQQPQIVYQQPQPVYQPQCIQQPQVSYVVNSYRPNVLDYLNTGANVVNTVRGYKMYYSPNGTPVIYPNVGSNGNGEVQAGAPFNNNGSGGAVTLTNTWFHN